MSLKETLRPLIPLAIGLAIGGVGVTLFQQSMPGAPGSPEATAELLEVQLKAAENRILSLEVADPNGRRRPGGTFKDRVERLNGIVILDDAQRDAVFGIAARDSKDYDPAMGIEGADGNAVGQAAGGSSEEAMLSVLRPNQRKAYEAEQVRRREDARKEMESFGLTMPADWDMLDASGF
jgi:hypothetical protein